jgi:signal transduction histidine kinase
LFAVLAIALTGLIDHATGPLIAAGPLYVVPVALGTWYAGSRTGVILVSIALVMGFLADATSRDAPGFGVLFWNEVARGLILLFIVSILSRMREALAGQRRTAEADRDMAERLRAADEVKSTFVNAVSHELRTPVAVILGSARTLQELDHVLDKTDQDGLLAAVVRNARKLDRLVGDLLDTDRLSRGEVSVHLEETDLGTLVANVLKDMDVAGGRRIHVTGEKVNARVDPAKVERIVENLLSNALKYSPAEAPIEVTVERRPVGAAIVVEDGGPGVPAAERELVFAPFRRGREARETPGTGVGLSLVRAFAELHGGRAWVEDGTTGGARFVVTFPASAPQPQESRVEVGPRTRV